MAGLALAATIIYTTSRKKVIVINESPAEDTCNKTNIFIITDFVIITIDFIVVSIFFMDPFEIAPCCCRLLLTRL
ncbi:hypothetical protein QJS04_geneDACA006992 [Acorus gramineus]|uniref:Uncharacterized protein n=1 Tax=Acorus gramineus TaxID=55184 RepID=A0AAV9A2M0_ACOGR|nr:hypothetical protein QJS04_geneDACA006992 [Acorus gramineus]